MNNFAQIQEWSIHVLVACEESAAVRDAYIARGAAAISCDLYESATDGPHFRGDVRELLALKRWHVIAAFPPCTDFLGRYVEIRCWRPQPVVSTFT